MLDTTEETKETIIVVLTGFGPFGGVDENPSTLLIQALPAFLEEAQAPQPQVGTTDLLKPTWKAQVKDRIQEMVIVETSAEGVTQALDELVHKISKLVTAETTKVFCLHLGVNVSGTGYQLEQCAYNDASFRIPDQRGYQPNKAPILPEVPLGTTCETNCNISELVEQLSKTFPAIESKASTDPGRFVCNYLYYSSLNKIQKELTSVESTLFLHLPPFEKIPLEIQLEYLAELMRLVTRIDLN